MASVKPTKPTVSNIRINTSYGVSGVEVNLNLQELFQLSMKADVLGQHLGWLKNQHQEEVSNFAINQLEELGNFLGHILQSAGFKTDGRAEIFRSPKIEEEAQ